MNFIYTQFKSSRQTILFLGGSKDEQDLSLKTTAVCSVYEKPILVKKPLHKGTFNLRNMSNILASAKRFWMYAFMKQLLFPTYSSFTRTVLLNLLIEMHCNLYNELLKKFFYFTLPSFSNFSVLSCELWSRDHNISIWSTVNVRKTLTDCSVFCSRQIQKTQVFWKCSELNMRDGQSWSHFLG